MPMGAQMAMLSPAIGMPIGMMPFSACVF